MSELYHHGVLGQKWGVRRYQNKDGTLTNAGRRRLGHKEKKLNAKMESQRMRKENYRRLEKQAMEAGPMAYARWYTSGATRSQLKYIKSGEKACNKILSKLENQYTVSYNVLTGKYSLKEKHADN